MKISLLILLINFSSFVKSQSKIVGEIVDQSNEPIPFANLLILSTLDSSLIAGYPISDNKFEIKQAESNFILKITSLSYSDKFIFINGDTNLGTITLNSPALKGVQILEKKLAFEIDGDNTKINVSNSIFESSSSVNEILSKSPGVVVSGTDISVIGRGNTLIYIENKLSTVDALKAIPVSQIESIEIIRNPDASYEAAGMAVILVHLKDLGLNGFQGKILGHYTKAFYQLGYFDANINLHINKISLRASANTNFGSTGVQRVDHLQTNTAQTPYTADASFNEKTYLNFVSNYLLGLKYQLKPKHSVSFEYNGNNSPYDIDVTTKISQNFENDTININAQDFSTSPWKTDVFSANYIWKYDSIGSNLFIGGTYTSVLRSYRDSINESSLKQSIETLSHSISEGNNFDRLNIGQIDFTKNFQNGSKLKIGAKYSASISSTYINFNTVRNDSIINGYSNRKNFCNS